MLDAPHGDVVRPPLGALPEADPLEHDRARLLERDAAEPREEPPSDSGVIISTTSSALPAVSHLKIAARPAERVDEFATIVDEQARRHERFEQRVVRGEQVRDRVARQRAEFSGREDNPSRAAALRTGGRRRVSTWVRTSLYLR